MMDIRRDAVVAEALSWLGTPWLHAQCVKGAGVDCGFFIKGVLSNAIGLIADLVPEPYPSDWALHHSDERMLDIARGFAKQIPVNEALPGDILLFRYGRCLSHAALVVDYPKIIHAKRGEGVILDNCSRGEISGRDVVAFTYI